MCLEPFKKAVIPDNLKDLLKEKLNIMMFSEGTAIIHITPFGGVHSSGEPRETKCVSFEVQMGRIYYMISLVEYPKGVIFHVHVFYQHMGKEKIDHIDMIYSEIKKILIPEKKMRHPGEVAEQIMEVVPKEYKGEFEWLANDFFYKAPEQWRECFGRLNVYCNIILEGENPLRTDWKVKMISILTTIPEEELKNAKQ